MKREVIDKLRGADNEFRIYEKAIYTNTKKYFVHAGKKWQKRRYQIATYGWPQNIRLERITGDPKGLPHLGWAKQPRRYQDRSKYDAAGNLR